MENNTSPTKSHMVPEHLQKYLPSKKIQIIIGSLVVIAIVYGLRTPIIGLFNNIFKRTSPIPEPTTLIESVVDQEIKPLSIDEDTDGDGLADWQETLLGTDPLVVNSKTELPDSVRELVTATSKDLITTEDKLALKVYQRLKTDPKGTNIVESIQAATTKEVLDLADSMDKQLTTYTYDDTDLVDDNEASRTAYKNALVSFNTSLKLNPELVKDLYGGILNNERTVSMSTFQVALTQAVTKLLYMEVPMKLADEHLTLVNSIAHINDILGAQKTAVSDTSITYASLLVFQKNMNLATQTIDSLIQVLNTR